MNHETFLKLNGETTLRNPAILDNGCFTQLIDKTNLDFALVISQIFTRYSPIHGYPILDGGSTLIQLA